MPSRNDPIPKEIVPTITLQPTAELPGKITLMAVGDIMLGRSLGERIKDEGPGVPFVYVQELFRQADLIIGNLECAITDSRQPEPKRYTFSAPPEAAISLADAGVSAVSLSNNHSLDFGALGLMDTMGSLSEQGILTFGAGLNETQARTPAILKKNGVSIALLAYTDVPIESSTDFDTHSWIADEKNAGLAWIDRENMRSDIALAKLQADHVIVFFHYGIENLDHATKAQHNLAVAAIDAGATVVLGAHSHRLQEIEHYKGGLIIYSLGNFVFDGFDDLANRSAILQIILSKDQILDYRWYPVILVDGIPRPADQETAKVIESMLEREYILFPQGIDEPETSE